MRTTSCRVSAITGGRPGPRRLWPSYFRAMSRRCHAQERVRAHDGADFLEHAPPQVLRLSRQADALIVGEAQPTRAELPAEDAVLGLEIVDDLALLLVDPACERENEESERVRQRRHEAQGSRSAEERPHDRINGHYGITVAPNRAQRGKPRLQPRSCLRITAPVLDPTGAPRSGHPLFLMTGPPAVCSSPTVRSATS